MRRPVLFLAGWLTLVGTAWGQVTEENAQAVMQDLAKKHQAWSTKLNSPGVSAELNEVRRDSPRIYYEISTSGFPPGLKYTLVQWPANRLAPQQGLTGITLDSSGRAICAGTPGTCKGSGPNSPVELQLSPVKSEPVRFALVSDNDQHLRAVINFVPIPNRATANKCSLDEIMLAPLSSLVALQGSGYEPNAEVQFLSESEGEHHDGQVKTDSEGDFFFAMALGVKGKDRGVVKLSVISPGCALSVHVPWGKDSYER